MGLQELWKGWREKVALDRRMKYEQMMDQTALQLFESYKYIVANTCDCGACYTDRQIEWFTYSARDLNYFAAWADQRFIWDSDDERLLDFADKCRNVQDEWDWKRNRQIYTKLKAKR